MEIMMWICPKCGNIAGGFAGDSCSQCNTVVILTTTTFDESMAMSATEEQQWCREVTEKYVKTSPLFDEKEQTKRLNEEVKERYEEQHQIKCPTCRSTSVQKISGLERGVSVAAWGLFSKKINKSFKCNKCGYAW